MDWRRGVNKAMLTKLWETCEECGERISEDDAVMHYHAGTVISLDENNNA